MIEVSYLGDTYDEYNDINLNYKKVGFCKYYQFTIIKKPKNVILAKDLIIVTLRSSIIIEKINSNVFIKNVK